KPEMFAGLQFTSSPVTRRRDEFTRMRLQLRIPAIERVFFTCEDSVQYFENGFHILKEVCQILYMEGPNPVSSAQGSTSENSGHGLPVLNKEGNLASLDTDEGGWVFDSSSSEVQMLHRVILYSLFLQGLETDSAIVKKIRQAIDNQTEVTVQLINYTKTDVALLSQHFKKLLEKARNDAEKKYDEINEQNKILHSHLEALHIRKAKKEHNAAGISFGSSSADTFGDAGLQTVMTCLRNSKEI
ncbi:hypothetical protein S245_038267, partial [Arachis hypogaea]